MDIIDNLIIDATNLCHIHFHGNKNSDDDEYISMTFMTLLNNIKFLYYKFKPKRIVMVFDNGPKSWRKVYTEDIDECITHLAYKSERRLNKTPKELIRLENLEKNIICLREMFEQYTSVLVLSKKFLEADDIIARYVQIFHEEKNIIISSDKDFHQLITDNVRLYNPVSNQFRTLSDWDDNPKLFMFEKCIRGDRGDSVISSYPRLQRKKIIKAFNDEFEMNNIMNHSFKVEFLDKNGVLQQRSYITKDIYEENRLLMDLSYQPEHIKDMAEKHILKKMEENISNRMSMFNFLKFCNKYQLVNIIKNAESFIKPFNL